MSGYLRLLSLLLAGLTLACSEPTGGDWGSSLRGQVVDSVSGQPVADVGIYVTDTIDDQLVDNTDSTGTFTLVDFGFWEFDVFFVKDGYATKELRLGTKSARSDVVGVIVTLSP